MLERYRQIPVGQERKTKDLWKFEGTFLELSDSQAGKRNVKGYGNTVDPSLIDGDNDTPMIELVPPPESHLVLGPVNTPYKETEHVWKGWTRVM